MRRIAGFILIVGALLAPFPLFAAGMSCAPHSCCTALRIQASDVDCCQTSICSDPEPAAPAVVPGPQHSSADLSATTASETTLSPERPVLHALVTGSPPVATRLRLAHLSTLLI